MMETLEAWLSRLSRPRPQIINLRPELRQRFGDAFNGSSLCERLTIRGPANDGDLFCDS
jgi:hypothetical protein